MGNEQQRKLKRMNRSRDESVNQTSVNSVDVVVDDDVVEDSSSDKDYEFEVNKRKYDFHFVNTRVLMIYRSNIVTPEMV